MKSLLCNLVEPEYLAKFLIVSCDEVFKVYGGECLESFFIKEPKLSGSEKYYAKQGNFEGKQGTFLKRII